MPLALSFPAERTPPPKDLEVRPKLVKAWIDSLPLSQVLDTTRKLTIHLAALNRAKLDLDTRLQILELYRPVCATAHEELESLYEKAALPLAPRPREALVLARDLAAEMATGYKIALVERGARLLPFGGRKQLPVLLSRAMEYLVTGLVASYKSYTPAPLGSWRELHELYLHAEAEGVAREEVDAESKATVFDAYAEALLLSLTDPYRLVQGELERIRALARAWRGSVTLGRVRPATAPGGHFLVPCDTDKPPKPMLSANDDAGGPNWRLLDTNAVVDRLRARKQAAETGNVSAAMAKTMGPEGVALVSRLVTLWGDPPKRAFRRTPAEASVAICVGLRAVGHFVSFEPRMDARAEAEALRKGITMPMMALPTDDAAQPVPVFEWDVVNQSAGGLKVRRMGATQQPIGVGEVVGIKFMDRTRWTIGAVRWITMFDEGGMEFGIQFLGGMATPVWVQPTVATSPQAKPGLLLAVGDDATEADSLLTPPNTFSDLREFEVDRAGTVSRVRAAGLIEKTGRFELFHFSPT
jgi:cyclic-di-GMP-binding protein